jgi:hypothetical protein
VSIYSSGTVAITATHALGGRIVRSLPWVCRQIYAEDGESSLLAVRLPRVELNRLVSREGAKPQGIYRTTHFAIKPASATLPLHAFRGD